MIRQEAILQSPLRVLDRTLRGGLGPGHLGLIVAPAGVGKSGCLAQLGLDALLRGRWVLHVALERPVEHVSARYDALFEALADAVQLAGRQDVGASIARRRLIRSVPGASFGAAALDAALAAFEAHLGRAPSCILVDGFRWDADAAPEAVRALKGSAARVGAELWMTARAAGASSAPPLAGPCAALVDVGLLLAPDGPHVRLTLLKDFERVPAPDVPLVIEGGALRWPAEDEGLVAPAERSPEDFTLLAGGAAGAEEEFGACAERWGVREVTFTFAGRRGLKRTRGLVELTEAELRVGQVSPLYLKAHLHRAYADSPELQRVLAAIWHQVSQAGEVFAVGAITPDGTASGGTGWAAELARHWGKPVHLFDQEREGWLRWDGRGWAAEAPPAVTHDRFAGAGTRALSSAGRAAIASLFERSFGAPRA